MAQFRVGQRVRVISASSRYVAHCVGREGVVSFLSRHWSEVLGCECVAVVVDGATNAADSSGAFGFFAENLAPLTDPLAEQFIESIKKLRPYEEPKVREQIDVLEREFGL